MAKMHIFARNLTQKATLEEAGVVLNLGESVQHKEKERLETKI